MRPKFKSNMPTGAATTIISNTMTTRARATTAAIIRTGAARRAIITNGKIAPTILSRRIMRTTTAVSVGTHEAETNLGTMADDARGTVTIITKMEIEIATDSATIMAIGIPEAEAENLAEAIVERCPAQRHGALIAPLGHPLSVLTKLGTPSVGVPDV